MSAKKSSGRKVILLVLAWVVAAGVAILIGISALTWRLPFIHPQTHEETARARPAAGQQDIAYWTCVMHPSVKQPGPGKCPVCSMDLVPVKKGAGLVLTQKQRELIPVKTEPVGFHPVEKEIRTVGVLDYNERNVGYVSTRVSGWIEQVFVDFAGTKVREGDHLVKIYSRELVPAQQEYLGTLKYLGALATADDETRKRAERDVADAEEKLRLLGLTPEQVKEIKERGTVHTELVLHAPTGGTVIEKEAYKGRYVEAGESLYKIANLSSLWMIADVYEYEMPWLRSAVAPLLGLNHRPTAQSAGRWIPTQLKSSANFPLRNGPTGGGQDVQITCDARPGEEFTGKVWFIYPYLRTETRTVKVLVEVPNRDERLKPGMYVTARLAVSLRDIYQPAARPPYACPMHPWIASDQPGKCSLCGMDLEKTDLEPNGEEPEGQAYWTCPMHPEVHEKEPGNCPICGMKLVERKAEKPLTKTVLTCGMPGHPEFEPGTEPKDGKCPVCEMKLVEKEITVPGPGVAQASSPADSQQPRPLFKYVCPDHPDQISTEPGKCPTDGKELVMTDEVLSVPKTAVIDTGERTVVYVDKGEAGYVPTEVVLGPEGWASHDGARTRLFPIIKGLQPGEMVVAHGNFLIDSESQITGAAAMAYGGAIGREEAPTPPGHKH